MDNHHSLVIFYPDKDERHERSRGIGKPKRNKWVIVAYKDAGLEQVKPARWDGDFYRDTDGLRINGVEWWANFPVHPRNKAKRW